MRSDLSMAGQISMVIHGCFYSIRQHHSMRRSLNHEALHNAAYLLILFRIKFCNQFTWDSHNFSHCQCGKSDTQMSAFSHINDFICVRFHWLPVPLQIQFKLCILVYCSLHGLHNCTHPSLNASLTWFAILFMSTTGCPQIPDKVCRTSLFCCMPFIIGYTAFCKRLQ